MVFSFTFCQEPDFSYIKMLYNLIFFSKEDTLDLLCTLIIEITGVKDIKINEPRYLLYCLSSQNDTMYKNFCNNKQDFIILSVVLVNFAKLLTKIKRNYFSIQECDNKETYNRLGKLIRIIYEKKEIFRWESNFDDRKGFILIYYYLDDLQKKDFDPNSYGKKLYIVNENGYAWLTDKKNKLKIANKIRKVLVQPNINRLLTTYRAIAETLCLYKNNPTFYCPWCNPDNKLLATNKKPRVKDDCKQIWEFIVKYSDKYTDKYLNEHITHLLLISVISFVHRNTHHATTLLPLKSLSILTLRSSCEILRTSQLLISFFI